MPSRKDLRDYQITMVDLIKKIPYILLAVDMGLGKTIATLTAIRDLFDSLEINKVLVVAPLLVAENTWPNEIKGWDHTKVLRYSVVTGNQIDRISALQADAEIYIINKENLPWLETYYSAIASALPKSEKKNAFPFDMCVVDEASMLKSGSKQTIKVKSSALKIAQEIKSAETLTLKQKYMLIEIKHRRLSARSKKSKEELLIDMNKIEDAILAATEFNEFDKKLLVHELTKPQHSRSGVLYKFRPFFDRVVELTGTPAPNGLQDLWGLIYFLDLGKRLFSAKTTFLQTFFREDKYTRKITNHEWSFKIIMDKVRDIMFSMKTEDHLTLPEVIHNPRYVNLTESEKKKYTKFKKDYYLEDFDIEAVNEGVLINKLLQFANGHCYDEDKNICHIHDHKLNELDIIVEEAMGQPLLVLYSYQFDLDTIKKKYPYALEINEVKDVENKWNNGEIRMLLAHPQSAAHGLNLQKGIGHQAVWYGLPWSLELFLQANKRLWRSGQKNAVILHYILTRDTADERVYNTLQIKDAKQSDVIDAVKIDFERRKLLDV